MEGRARFSEQFTGGSFPYDLAKAMDRAFSPPDRFFVNPDDFEVVTAWTCQRFAGGVTGVIEHRSQVCHDCEPVVIVRRRREGGIER